MKVSVNEADLGDEARWVGFDHVGHQELSDLWGSGVTVAAQHGMKSKTNRSGFGVAEAVMVRIDLKRLPLAAAMDAAFTQEHASVAAYRENPLGGGELLLAFELPSPITDAKTFVRLMAGIETLYAGSCRHASALEPFGLHAPGESVVMGRSLNDAAVKWLDQLGLEAKERQRGEGAFIRSRYTIDRTATVTLAGGEEAILEQLPPHTSVYCPVHVDRVPRAVVHWYSDGTPGIQCDHCRRTYAAPNTRSGYDFGHFDRVVAELAANQPTVINHGVESEGNDVIRYAEQYLPSEALVEASTRPRVPAEPARQRKPAMVSDPDRLPDRPTQLDLVSGVTFVKSPKGTNKTGVLEPFVAVCKRQSLGVLMIGHRRSLLQAVADRLKVDCYFVVDSPEPSEDKSPGDEIHGGGKDEAEVARYRFVEPKRRYAICLDSLVELDPSNGDHRYEVVVIDEAEQVFAHLVGDTLKDRRREVFARLSYYLRAARHVVLLDADLNMITMEAAFEIFRADTPVRFIVNQPTLQRGSTQMYASRGQLVQVLTDRVQSGKKIYVATNSKKRAYELERLVRESSPKSRVAVVTSENTQTVEIQSLLGDVRDRFEHHLDVLIASPAIGTGIDITFKDSNNDPRSLVDCVFGVFEGNIVTHFDIDQQLMRVRHPGEVHVWVDTKPLNYETDVGCIKRELEKSVRATVYLLRYEDDGKPVYADDGGLVNIWARVLAASRGSKNRLAPLFTALREDAGWCPVSVQPDAEASKAGKEAMGAAKDARLQDREQHILSAAEISIAQAKKLQDQQDRGASLTEADRWALERHRIEQFYGGEEISAELIELDDEGRTRQAVMRLECLTSNRDWFANRDAEEIERGLLPFDRRRLLVQRDILETLLVAAGLFDAQARQFRIDVMVTAADLSQFMAAVEAKAKQIETIFGMTLNADRRQNPVGQLKRVLALVGLEVVLTETVQKDGKKTRRYALPSGRLDDLVAAVARRDARFKRDDAVPRGLQKDRVAPDSAKEMRAYVLKLRAGKAGGAVLGSDVPA